MQPAPPVEVEVEDRVDDVEAADPQPDGEEQQPRDGAERPAHRQPRGRRRQAQREAERVVAEPREALGVGIEDEGGQRDGPEVAARLGELERRDDEQRHRHGREEPDLASAQAPGRQLARGRARVARVELGVDQPVERHGRAARPDHGDRDPHQLRPGRHAVRRQKRAGVGEGQRVDAVLDLDEPGEECGLGRRRRSRARRTSPGQPAGAAGASPLAAVSPLAAGRSGGGCLGGLAPGGFALGGVAYGFALGGFAPGGAARSWRVRPWRAHRPSEQRRPRLRRWRPRPCRRPRLCPQRRRRRRRRPPRHPRMRAARACARTSRAGR